MTDSVKRSALAEIRDAAWAPVYDPGRSDETPGEVSVHGPMAGGPARVVRRWPDGPGTRRQRPGIRRSRRVGYDNAWITVWHDEVTRPDGSPGDLRCGPFHEHGGRGPRRRRGRPRAARRAASVRARRLLMGDPRGRRARGRGALDGARHELREETGVEADTWRELARVHLSNSVSDELAMLSRHRYPPREGDARSDQGARGALAAVRGGAGHDARRADHRCDDGRGGRAPRRSSARAVTPAPERSGWFLCVAIWMPSSSGGIGSSAAYWFSRALGEGVLSLEPFEARPAAAAAKVSTAAAATAAGPTGAATTEPAP